MITRMFLSVCLVFCASSGFSRPGDEVVFSNLNPFNQRSSAKWGGVLTDIVRHEAPGDSNNYGDLVTLGHETSHGIHAYLRGHVDHPGRRINAFYVLDRRAVIVDEPHIRKSQIGSFVPPSLRESRYSAYVTGQTAWDDTPLYVWDEWNAYVNGAAAGVDLAQSNLWTYGWRDALMGPLEFVVYALASAMAVKQLDAQYFANNLQFREFLAFNVERSMQLFFAGRGFASFAYEKQDQYYQKLIASPDAESLRQFVRNTYGTDWTMEVLGF